MSQRGAILDCRGRVLAGSNKIQTIFAEPRMINDVEGTSIKLAPIVHIGARRIYEAITQSRNPGFVKIKADADANQCIAADKLSGIGVQTDWQRYYPMGRVASHIVGFTDIDNVGLGGVELEYNSKLAGSPGQNIFFADVRRRPIRLKEHGSRLADGVGIILTIDAAIQEFARSELIKQYESYEAESAVAIVAEPKTGAILAMVSLPDFEPGAIGLSDVNSIRNRATTDEFEPGSILKPIAAAIALDEGVVNTNEKIFCENGDYRGKGFGKIGEYRRGFGNLNVRGILVNSSNIGMAKIGQRLGKDKLYKGLRLFGFGKKTGLDLPGEADGLLWPVKRWTGYSVTRIPFGHELSVTAVQLVQAFCVLANDGGRVKPFLVKAIVDNDGNIVNRNNGFAKSTQSSATLENKASAVGFIIKPEVAKWVVRQALTGVVKEGTGKKAALKGRDVFGKTGTAQMAKSDSKGYAEKDYVASFVGGAPADDPAVVILVSIRKPNVRLGKGYTGGTVAAPVAGKILEKTLNYLERQSQ